MTKKPQTGNINFDWGAYMAESLASTGTINKSIKTKNKTCKVYSFKPEKEIYEDLDKYTHGAPIESKDLSYGKIFNIKSISRAELSNKNNGTHDLLVDTEEGHSFIIPLDKEKEYVTTFGYDDVDQFYESLKNINPNDFGSHGLKLMVMDNNRVSLTEGFNESIRNEFDEQLKATSTAYEATITGYNNGGYLVEVMGLSAFMPMSMSGIFCQKSEMETHVGEKTRVVIKSKTLDRGYVVSHRDYENYIRKSMLSNLDLDGTPYTGTVTGIDDKYGVFVKFTDESNPDYVYVGMIHHSRLSEKATEMIQKGDLIVGDEIIVYVTGIDSKDRIVLSDIHPKDLGEDNLVPGEDD